MTRGHAGVVKLAGREDLWRTRVVHYRVVYQILDDVLLVTVTKVALRDESTYRYERYIPRLSRRGPKTLRVWADLRSARGGPAGQRPKPGSQSR